MKTRNFILSMIALCCMTMAQAQRTDVMTATLQHGDDVTVFTSPTAFANAYNAAADGDVITLSPGTFNTVSTITKSITIYGSGWEEDATNEIIPSIINGNLDYQTGSDEISLEHIRLEGVYVNGAVLVKQTSDMLISKCRINYFQISGNNAAGISIRQCYLTNNNSTYSWDGCIRGSAFVNGLEVRNCYLAGLNQYNNSNSQVLIDHCLLPYSVVAYNNLDMHSHCPALYTNNIIAQINISDDGPLCLQAGSIARNNIFINVSSSDQLNGCTLENNWLKNDWSPLGSLFADGNTNNLGYSATRTFTLNHPETFVGTDNTPVGINGGGLTWNKIPSTPIVKNLQLNVSGTNLNVTFDAETR